MKNRFFLILLLGLMLTTTSCFKDLDDNLRKPGKFENKSFVYNGLNIFYLYKSEIAELNDGYFPNTEERNTFIDSFYTPEELFDYLLSPQDRFSIIVPNFHILEEMLSGISMNNGMEFGLVRISSSGEVFGYVRYVLPGTSAEEAGVKRGMIFNRIDGLILNENNFRELLNPNVYTIGLAELSGSTLLPLNEEFLLTKIDYTENPVYLDKVVDTLGHKIGYLMYNAFTNTFDDQLNEVFGNFKAEGVTDLVLDLRYNGGGSIETSKDLSSMITGQFTGQLFATEEFNENFPDVELLFDTEVKSGASINSLNLDRVYVLTTQSTASASELLINGLNPYINVVQIGGTTTGKFQGSITVYDSPDFSRAAVQPGSTYAMQPLVLKTVNSAGFTGFVDGLEPDIELFEDYTDLGVLGHPSEPLFNAAISHILGVMALPAATGHSVEGSHIQVGESKMNLLNYQRMYLTE